VAAAFALSFGAVSTASAQSYSPDVMAKCAQTVGQMKFEGWAADRNKEMMMMSCQSNGGVIPGTTEQSSPASLKPKARR
jgi:hypothetical protein